MNTYRNVIFRVVLFACDIWTFKLREECRLRVSDNRVLRGVFGLKRVEVTGKGENYIVRSLVICIHQQIFFE